MSILCCFVYFFAPFPLSPEPQERWHSRGQRFDPACNVRIGAGVKIVNPQYVSLGDNVTLSDDVTLIARGEGGITIQSGAYLCERVYLDTEDEDDGYIVVGERVYLGTGTTMFGHKGLEIGDDTLIAQNVTLTPYSHIFDDPTRNILVKAVTPEK